MTYREQIEQLEILAEECVLRGDPPVKAGIRCEWCGVELAVDWADRASLIDGMEAHGALCPRPKDS